MHKQQVNLITFLSSNYPDFRKNKDLFNETHNNFFDNVYNLTENDLDEFIMQKINYNIKKYDTLRGYGYWVWKPYIIYNKLCELNDNDILIHLDAHCNMNYFLKDDLFNKIILTNINKENNFILSGSHCGSDDYNYTTYKLRKIIEKYLNYKFSKDELKSGQFESGILIIKKCDKSMKVIKQWLDIMLNNTVYITDKYNNDSKNPKTFVENRHDQSVLSLLLKYNKVPVIYDINWKNFNNF